MKPPHHSGTHHKQSALVRAAANNDPNTRCWRCHRTLAEHPPHKTGKQPTWQAGHTITAAINPPAWTNTKTPPPPGTWLAPEASTCNATDGATLGAARQSTGYDWP